MTHIPIRGRTSREVKINVNIIVEQPLWKSYIAY